MSSKPWRLPPPQAGLGSEFFSRDMWCSSREQITLSQYIKTLESSGAEGPPTDDANRAAVIQAAYRGRQTRRCSRSADSPAA